MTEALIEWFADLTETCTTLPKLIQDRTIDISLTDDNPTNVRMRVECHELFNSLLDTETVEPHELPDLVACIEKCGSRFGKDLWVCRKRKQRPGKVARYYIPDEHLSLFDACGPKIP
jgi:hypothetical protein